MLVLLGLLLFYGLRFIGGVLWRMPSAYFHLVMAWAFIASAAVHGLGVIFDPRHAGGHAVLMLLGYVYAGFECFIIANLPIEHNLPKAKVVP